MKRKLNNKKGFTLVELLVSLAILVLFGSIVTYGIDVAMKTYRDMTFASNSRLLQDDINTAFGTIVRTSTVVKDTTEVNSKELKDSEKPELYFRSSHYSGTLDYGKIAVDSDTGQFYIYSEKDETGEITNCGLVSPGVYDNMKVKDAKISYENKAGYALITLSYTIYSAESSNYQKACECSYKTVNTTSVMVVENVV